MKPADSINNATLLARASTADVYTWGIGQVLKRFHERTPFHANELAATRIAHEARLPVPEVIDGLIEVSEREGIIFKRVDGPIMTEYIEDHPEKVEYCAKQAAALHARIHSTQVSDLLSLVEVLTWSIEQADLIDEKTRNTVLDVLNELPVEGVLCHNDFHPNNIIMSSQGPVIIDWAIGTRGSSLADLARTWLISKLWLGGLDEKNAPVHLQLVWQRYWETFFRQYAEFRPFREEDLKPWRIVMVTASLVWDKRIPSIDQRVSFVKAALGNAKHPWM